MRILHVTRELASDRRFGMGRSLEPVIEALQGHAHEVRYLTQLDQGERALAFQKRWTQRLLPLLRRCFGAAAEPFVLVWAERLNMGRLAAKVAASSKADIVHLHDPWLAWGFRLCRRWYAARYGAQGCRWGLTEHGFGSYSQAIREEGIPYTLALLRCNLRLEASVLRAAHWVICPTHSAREQLARDMGLPEVPAHWHVIPHARPGLRERSRLEARRALGWNDSEFHVLAIGRLNPVKRFDKLVQACLCVGRPLHLTLLGEGDAAPLNALVDQHREHRSATAPAAPVALRLEVKCVTDVSPYLCAADIYLSSSRNESFGIANLEALAAGLPSICTAAGGVPEVTGGCAWLVPAGDQGLVDHLAQALVDLIANPQRRAQLAQAGRQRGAAWPDAKAVSYAYEAVYLGHPPIALFPATAATLVLAPRAAPEPASALVGTLASVGTSVVASVATAAVLPAAMPAPEVGELCSLPQRLDLAAARRVLVLAPHPDDETIGCGGALALLARAGVALHVVLVSDGSGAGGLPPDAAAVRQAEFVRALQQLGVSSHALLGFPDGELMLSPELLAAIAQQVDAFAPDWIFCPHAGDLHRDHRVVAAAARQAALASPSVQRLCEYETWSPVQPSHVLDIGAVLATKLAALKQHETALACGNYVEATLGLARYRALLLGAPVQGGAAEAYRCWSREQGFGGGLTPPVSHGIDRLNG